MKIEKIISRVHWGESYSRYFSIHKLDLYLQNFEIELKRFFPHGMNHLLAIGRGFAVKWYFDEDQFSQLAADVASRTLRDSRVGEDHIKKMTTRAAIGIQQINKFDREHFSTYSAGELATAFKKFRLAANRQMAIIYAGVVIDRDLFSEARKLLAKRLSGKKLEKAFTVVTTPLEPTPIALEEVDLCRIARNRRNEAQFERNLECHRKKYLWIGMRFVDNDPVNLDDLKARAQSMSQRRCRYVIRESRRETENKKKTFHAIIRSFSHTERRFFRLVNIYSCLRHQRDTYRGATYYYGHFLYKEIKRRMGAQWAELLTYTVRELEQYLSHGITLEQKKIKNRVLQFLYVILHNHEYVITDSKTIRSIIRMCRLEGFRKASHASRIVGQGASAGIVRGRARIIHLSRLYEDLAAVQPGEIMITESTKPEYVPAMRRAAAIVTDEGGITCHAAIVAREMNKPCVIGTKIATKVFKDGDRVEVDANRGIVRKV